MPLEDRDFIETNTLEEMVAGRRKNSFSERMQRLCRTSGFRDFALVEMEIRGADFMPIVQESSFSDEELMALVGGGELGDCSVFELLRVSTVPFGWETGLELGTGTGTSQNRDQSPDNEMDLALAEMGYEGGYCVPVHTAHGSRYVFIFLGDQRETYNHYPNLVFSATELFEDYCAAKQTQTDDRPYNLNNLEFEALSWAASNEGPVEASAFFALSEHTLMILLRSVKKKLGVSTVSQAVAKAMREGFLRSV